MNTTNYAFGEDEKAHEALSLRVLTKDANFILPYLKHDFLVLDIGCGPGSITCGFAAHCPGGHVTGVDSSPTVLEKARTDARHLNNITFRHGDITHGLLDLADGSFDVVFCHQVLVHLCDPVAALKEMRRLAKPDGGLVAIRESLTTLWHPSNRILEGSMGWMHRAFRAASKVDGSNLDPGASTNLPHVWAREAGFAKETIVLSSAGGETVIDEDGKTQRVLGWEYLTAESNPFRSQLINAGATEKDMNVITEALEEWKSSPDAWQLWLSSEMIWKK